MPNTSNNMPIFDGEEVATNEDDNNTPQQSIAARALAASRPVGADYLEGLNPEQADAVESLEGPLLVLAGAGTGKTRVLTSRIAHILATGKAWPSQILSVTFTNKAAREMKSRIAKYVGDSADGIDDKRWPARQLAGHIDSWKNKALGPDDISEGDARAFGDGKGRELYKQYQERLKILNAVDFGDLLTECIRLFRENEDILVQYQERFKYILVDEYQDTNVAQYLWLRLLAQGQVRRDEKLIGSGTVAPTNICCVGDDDQSIYGWRGAEVDNILRFDRDFPGAKVIRLERNYRSTSHILAAASHLISHNEGRLGKTLFTDDNDPEETKIKVSACWDSEEEARTVGEEIEQFQRRGKKLNDMAILVRASFQMREFEDRFVTLGLNYRVIGGPRFYERKEIRDCMAYFRTVSQPADDLAFERIINTPKRGIGDTSVRIIHDNARARGIPLFRAAQELCESEELKPKTRSTLKKLLEDFGRWSGNLETMPHTQLAEMILEESGYTQMWQNDRAADAPGRLENLKELIRSMEEFETLRGFLEHISLVMDTDKNEDMDAVSLMTLHSAKGLEFDHVFLPGWEEGLFPHQRSLDESGKSGLEEERRLAYVGITRAKKDCSIYFTSNRRIHGLWQNSIPSRFIDELPAAHVDIAEPSNSYGGYGAQGSGGTYGASRFDTADAFGGNSYSTPGWKRAQSRNPDGQRANAARSNWGTRSGNRSGSGGAGKTIDGDLVASSVEEMTSSFKVGERVFHLKFGNGNVALVDGNKLTIDFDKAGQKRVLDSFVEAV